MATPGSMTEVETETKDEVSKPPKTYKLVLKMSWKKFKEYFQSNDVLDSHKKMKKERKAILNKVNKGEPISEEEREILNSSFRELLFMLFQNVERCLLSYLELEQSDSPQLQSFKIRAATDVTLWLKHLDSHISKCLEDILDSNLPEDEMIEKTKKVLDDLKNELKPDNFSEFLSAPEDPEISSKDASNQQSYGDKDDNREEGEGMWDFFADFFII